MKFLFNHKEIKYWRITFSFFLGFFNDCVEEKSDEEASEWVSEREQEKYETNF